MVKIKLATLSDIQNLVKFGAEFKEEKEILKDIPVILEDISFWFAECIMSGGNYVFIAEEDDEICGFLVVSEMSCPWNSQHRYLIDLLFLARKGGIKLIRTVKRLAQKKGMDSVVLSVSSKKDRSDKFLNHIGQHVGGVYELKVQNNE